METTYSFIKTILVFLPIFFLTAYIASQMFVPKNSKEPKLFSFFKLPKIKKYITIKEAVEMMVYKELLSPEVAAEVSAHVKNWDDHRSVLYKPNAPEDICQEITKINRFVDQYNKDVIEYNQNLEFNLRKEKYLKKYKKMTPSYQIEKHLLGVKDDTKPN